MQTISGDPKHGSTGRLRFPMKCLNVKRGSKAVESKEPPLTLRRTLALVVVGAGLDGLLRRCGWNLVFRRGQEERTIVMAHTPVAPNKLEKEKSARTTRPRLRLRTVHFGTATIGAVVNTNSTHDTPPTN